MTETLNVNGRQVRPFDGVGQPPPAGARKASPPVRSAAAYPSNGDKRAPSLEEALRRAGLRDGMTLSTHHHLRDGDHVAGMLFEAAARLGARGLVWAPSAAFPCHAPLIDALRAGTLRRIEGSLNGPLGEFASFGGMLPDLAVLQSHGGRYRALQDGDLHVDIAVIAAPAADAFGNCTGTLGPSACGPLGFALGDAQYADHVIVVTDHLVDFPCAPWAIQGTLVDQVVEVASIGDPARIVSGTTQVTRSPDRLLIAELTARFVMETGLARDGFSFQAGAGGTSLAFTLALRDRMRAAGLRARFVRGGSTQQLVEMLESGLTDYILDGQSFDLAGVRSLRDNPRHVQTNPSITYNYHGKGHVAALVDVAVLGATEIDLAFNANVVTHSDGLMLHGIGGWQDALFAGCSILALPSFRDRVPVIKDSVTTLCAPGEMVDVVVTERGIAVNPRREDLLDAARRARLPLRTLASLKDEAEALCGGPPAPARTTDEVIGVVQWVDGSVIDVVRRVVG
ncbi:MAG: citrate lyase subunit alpha [Thermoflexales bacterium]|nr:citrate lyase subunit alpha [Thermoflexales bacterium]